MEFQTADRLDVVIANFSQLEEELSACMRYVPFSAENQEVVSPKFIPIMLESCTLIESIFRRMTRDKNRHNLRTYSELVEPQLELTEATTMLLSSPLQFLRPFQQWTQAPPAWWNAYNQLKHDRIASYQVASYYHTVSELAGLHQVIARCGLFVDKLPKAGWVEATDPHVSDLMLCLNVGCPPPDMPAETRLFVSPIHGDFASWDTDPPTIDPAWEFSWRVKFHIWYHQDA